MSFPASLTVVTVTGTFLNAAGAPRAGRVIFRTRGVSMSGADDTFVVPRVLAAFLDGAGHFSISLPAGDDPDWVPVGWTYAVTADFGDDGRQFLGNILVPYNLGPTVSLASLAPVPASNGQLYALYNDPRFSGTGGGGSGVSSVFGRTGVVVKQAGDYTKGDVGLGNVDNTSDANKPVSTLQAAADASVAANASSALTIGLAGKANTSHSHAETDVTSLVSDLANKSAVGHTHAEADVASLVADLAAKQPLDADLTTLAGLTATTGNVIQSVASAWASVTPATLKGTLGLVKGDVGLGNVDNTSDASKPVSTAQQTALNLKADLASPTFTGTPSLPTGTTGVTQTPGDSTTKLATTAFVAALGATLQPLDSDLTTIAGLTPTTNNIIQSVAGAWASRTPAQAKAALAIANTDVSGLGGAAVLSVGTTAGTVAAGDDSRITGAVQKSTFTTKGDILTTTAASTIARLAVGSDGQVLTADAASAGGVKWGAAGGSGSYSLPEGLDPPAGYSQAITPGRTSINLTMALNRTYFVPLPMGATTRTLTSLTIEIRTASAAGGLISCSLCSATGRLPNAEIANYGTKAADTTGNKTWASGASLTANTLYYAAASLTVAAGAAVVALDAFNPYVAANAAFTGTNAFGAYVMNQALPLGATTFTYFDVDACIRIVAVFS